MVSLEGFAQGCKNHLNLAQYSRGHGALSTLAKAVSLLVTGIPALAGWGASSLLGSCLAGRATPLGEGSEPIHHTSSKAQRLAPGPSLVPPDLLKSTAETFSTELSSAIGVDSGESNFLRVMRSMGGVRGVPEVFVYLRNALSLLKNNPDLNQRISVKEGETYRSLSLKEFFNEILETEHLSRIVGCLEIDLPGRERMLQKETGMTHEEIKKCKQDAINIGKEMLGFLKELKEYGNLD